MAWNGYRQPRAAGGGALNGYTAPRAKQCWAVGQVVNVGFVKGLVVKAKVDCEYRLWQPSTNRWYAFQPHLGLFRTDEMGAAA